MVIGNGLVTYTIQDAKKECESLMKGKELRKAVIPTIDTLTYWISDIGEMFGCQKMATMFLTKPLKIEHRYKSGASIRYSIGGGKQAQAFMQKVMYCTWVLGYWQEDLELETIDGNVYNYQLSNIKLKEKEFPITLHNNLNSLQQTYKSHFLDCAWYALFVSSRIDLETAKDIASNSFYELCSADKRYDNDNFVGLWKMKVKQRTLDYLTYKNRFEDSLYYKEDNGEEKIGKADKEQDIVDWRKHISGNKTRQIIERWLNNDTPTEIAKDMGVTLGTVGSCITRSIQKLKQEYSKDIQIVNTF